MRFTEKIGRFGLAIGVAITVSACGSAPSRQAQAWTGTTTSGTDVHPLRVDVAVDGDDW